MYSNLVHSTIWLTIFSETTVLTWLVVAANLVGLSLVKVAAASGRATLLAGLMWVDLAVGEAVLLNSLVCTMLGKIVGKE